MKVSPVPVDRRVFPIWQFPPKSVPDPNPCGRVAREVLPVPPAMKANIPLNCPREMSHKIGFFHDICH